MLEGKSWCITTGLLVSNAKCRDAGKGSEKVGSAGCGSGDSFNPIERLVYITCGHRTHRVGFPRPMRPALQSDFMGGLEIRMTL